MSTCRAGNVIGGGDFAADRIIPDCLRAAEKGEQIIVRNPYSTRPYQHVLEPIMAYLLIAQKQYEAPSLAGSYNIGPNDTDCYTTGDLVTLFCDKWNQNHKIQMSWKNVHDGGPHEASFLKLDCSLVRNVFQWEPRWNVETAIEKIIEWYECFTSEDIVFDIMNRQINTYIFKDK